MAEPSSPGDTISTQIGPGATNVAAGNNVTQINYQLAPALPIDAETRLATAQAHLAELPLDTISALATLPAGSSMPLTPNALFVGRTDELRLLARTLKNGQTMAIGPAIAAATGGGGYGKTQLAVEFAHRYGAYFAGGVFWLNFANADGVSAEIARCGGAGALNLRPDYATLKLDDQVRLVLACWQDGQPRLLIFDNCEAETLLDAWRVPSGACRILVTSRRAEWSPHLNVQPLPLATLPRAESIALLGKFRPDLAADDAALAAIADELGDLPLALHLAGSYLHYYRHAVTPQAFLLELRAPALLQNRAFVAGRHATTLPTGHERDVARTFALSYDRLDAADAVDGLALKLLARAAYFAPNVPIPRALLLASADSNQAEMETALQAEDALHRLVELGLLESEADGALRLHRLLARFVQQAHTDDNAQLDVEQTASNEASRLNKAGYPLVLLAWQAHLRHITERACERQAKRAAMLCNELGYHLNAIGELTAARPYFEQALAIYRTVLGDQHRDTAQILNNLGGLLRAQGELTAARPYYEQALAIRQTVFGDQHPDTAQSLNNLGALLQDQGELAAARPYYEQALAIRQTVFGDQHPDTAQSLNNLGALLRAQGELAAARPYYEQALAIRQTVLGNQHPDTARSLNNLGYLLRAQSELAAARPYYEQALVIRQTVLGDQHPDTAQSLNNLGYLLQAQGELTAARPYYEQALAILEKRLGSQHPTTRVVRDNLAALLTELGEQET